MGATYAAIHVKGASIERAAEVIEQWLGAQGFTRNPDSASGQDLERRVLVFADAGWAVIVDEDLVWAPRLQSVLGRRVSAALSSDAIAIAVEHSDVATIQRFRRGRSTGRVRLPDDATRDDTTGHAVLRAPHLAALATSPDARRQLTDGVSVTDVFVDDAVARIASLVGIPHPGAGMHAWAEPPAGALRLRFALPPIGPIEHRPKPIALTDRSVVVSAGGQELALYTGGPLDNLTFTVGAQDGPSIEGVIIELSGTALEHLDLAGIVTVEGELHPLEPSRRGRFARFPRVTLTPVWVPVVRFTSAALFRMYQRAAEMLTTSWFRLRGTARTAGQAELVITAFDLSGRSLDADPLRQELDISPAPRMPVLPTPPPPQFDEPEERVRFLRALADYGGNTVIGGWFGLDARFDQLGPSVLAAASCLASWFARWVGPLEVSINAAGTTPSVTQRFAAGDQLADFAIVVRHLADEAVVRLHPPHDHEGPHGVLEIAHQPAGPAILDRETRARLTDNVRDPIVPIELAFSLPRPGDGAAPAELARLLHDLAIQAAAIEACVGGFVAPSARWPGGSHTHYEYLAGLWGANDRVAEARRRPRSPGWRVIVPHGAVAAIDLQPGVEPTEVAAGLLLATAAADPFAMTDAEREAIERTLLPAMTRLAPGPTSSDG
jgi:hypothetical protein